MNTEQSINQGIAYLASQGLNLVGVLNCRRLPDGVAEPLSQSVDLLAYSRLVVFGNTGQTLWQALQGVVKTTDDPIDDFSREVTRIFCQRYLNDTEAELVFPSAHSIPLQRIGDYLGWGVASPLGIGISAQHGLWWAYRSAVLTRVELPLSRRIAISMPCDDCADKPCVDACPASVVRTDQAFDVPGCFHFRNAPDSLCMDRCLARIACPVGKQYCYPEAMSRYIYRRSMSTVRSFCEN